MGMILFLLVIQKACLVEKFTMGSVGLDLGGGGLFSTRDVLQ